MPTRTSERPPQLTGPSADCPLCPRLQAFRSEWRQRQPDWFNAPVPTLLPPGGADDVRLLIVGLAPGLRGANRTGRPFTGDYAGDLLYRTMISFGLARGQYEARPDDGLELVGAAITNAVRCVPPQNKPIGAEIAACRGFLATTIAGMANLQAVLALGAIAHQSVVKALGGRLSHHRFGHGARHELGVTVFGSYHCSRYNTNTGVLTEEMFISIFSTIRGFLDSFDDPFG